MHGLLHATSYIWWPEIFFFLPGGDRNQTHVGLTAGTLTC